MKTELTPERLIELSEAISGLCLNVGSMQVSEKGHVEISESLRQHAEILRGCEPVYQFGNTEHGETVWWDVPKQIYDLGTQRPHRILYTTPQPDNHDARIAELQGLVDLQSKHLQDSMFENGKLRIENSRIAELENEVAEYKRTIAEYELKERNVLASRGIV